MSQDSAKINLLNYDRKQLRELFVEWGEKPFRAEQVMKWIYHYGYDSFDDMTNINKALRAKLQARCEIRGPEIATEQRASDGVIKWALRLDGGQEVETVYIPEADRATLCVSSQVGCALECSFCSTAKQGFNRNLSTAEIIGQVWRAARTIGLNGSTQDRPISNVVMMGMGEPLLNLSNVVPALDLMMDDFGFGLSKRRVTVSTSGVVPAMDKLGEMIDCAMAVSLHAPNDALRDELVPVNQKYPIKELIAACNRYLQVSKANSKITIEYTMIRGVNDQPEHAHQLGELLKQLPSKINLIPFNPHPGSDYQRCSNSQIDRFSKILQSYDYTVIVRKTRGDDIDAACGQLVGDVNDRTRRSLKFQRTNDNISVRVES